MVYVYIASVSEVPDPKECPVILEGLSEERKEKVLRCRYAKDRKQSLGAGLLLKHILNSRGIDQGQIKSGAHGKPEVEGIYFNISHSHDYVVCVVADKPVGCDIEKIGQIREGVAERFFTKKEVEYLKSFEGEEKVQEFYRIWTMKESYSKMTGEGLTLATDRMEFTFEEDVVVHRDGAKCVCFIKEYELPGYKLTVCSEDEKFTEKAELLPCLKY